MKKLILIFILFASQTFAQITLTSANNPTVGDMSRNTECDTTNINQGNAGANQTWSFPNVIGIDSITFNYVASSSTPYAAQFPNSNIAATFDNSVYSYFATSPSNFITYGTASPGLLIQYSNPQTIMQYPFTYTNSFTDNFTANFTINGFQTFRTGTTTATGDSWGTINLPAGSFPGALRVKYVTVSRDSTSIGTVAVTTITTYSWFVSGRKFPIFDISYLNITINGFPFANDKSVNYGVNTSIGISNISTETPDNYILSQNYPNPFNPTTKFRFAIPKTGLVKLTVFDAIGREVETLVNGQLTTGTYEVDWNATMYSGGTYFYRLQSGGFVETKNMILVK